MNSNLCHTKGVPNGGFGTACPIIACFNAITQGTQKNRAIDILDSERSFEEEDGLVNRNTEGRKTQQDCRGEGNEKARGRWAKYGHGEGEKRKEEGAGLRWPPVSRRCGGRSSSQDGRTALPCDVT